MSFVQPALFWAPCAREDYEKGGVLGSAGVQVIKTEKSEKMPCLTVMTELTLERQKCLSPSCCRQRQRLEPRLAGHCQ